MRMKQLFHTLWKIVLLLLFLAASFSFAMFQGGFVSWFLFYSFLPFAAYSIIVFFYPLRLFSVERAFESNELKAGDELKVTMTIRRSVPFPLYYVVMEDQGSELLASPLGWKKKTVVHPGWRRAFSYTYTIDHLPRGEHTFSALRVKTGDFFGIFEKEALIPCEDTLLVYPGVIDVPYRSLENRYDQGMTSSNVKIQKDTTMATGVRGYQPGDRFSWIHWKSFARTNELMTKEFEERQSHDVLVVLDREESAAFEPMVTFTASILHSISRKGAQVGLLSHGEERTFFPIRGGEGPQSQMQHHLAKVMPDSPERLERMLKGDRLHNAQSAAVIFVTSTISKEKILAINEYVKQSGSILLFLIKREGEAVSQEDRSLTAFASSRGVSMRILYEPEFSSAFAEVKRA